MGLIDRLLGRPVSKDVLTREVAGPTLAGVRSPIAGYPADGMNPVRLATILRSADHGDPLRYFELAEQIEERDLHYVGVLGTRKRSVSQIEVSVVAASDDKADVELADMVRNWIARDELADETFDILDAIGKGVSHTEIIWDTSEGQWQPTRLEWRDPRWFTYDRRDGRTPLLRGGETGNEQDSPLPAFKFINHTVKAKSGLPIRSGLARIAAWAWMFKAFTQRDWAIFVQTYGQPVRLGRFDSNASDADRATLWRAVANIAGDCAAIVPKGMDIEFIEAKNVTAGAEVYEKRADWLDRQMSKAVLGQTGTTDSKVGGLGDGGNKVHERVAGDIERADCKALAATLNRDLVRPWVMLERGPQQRYPRIKIERPKSEDLVQFSTALSKLVPLGLKVSQSEVRDKFRLTEPDVSEEVLQSPRRISAPSLERPSTALQSAQPRAAAADPADAVTDRLAKDTAGDVEAMLDQFRAMMSTASSLSELGAMLREAYPVFDAGQIAETLAEGLAAIKAAGMSDAEDESAQ